jgi:hypothetical protein
MSPNAVANLLAELRKAMEQTRAELAAVRARLDALEYKRPVGRPRKEEANA